MKNLKIKEINFLIGDAIGLTKNYPSNGFFTSRLEGGISDFVLVDKNTEYIIFICPEETFDSLTIDSEEIISLPETNTDTYKGDFILEFARILLNRK
jgi:hypothetical protein